VVTVNPVTKLARANSSTTRSRARRTRRRRRDPCLAARLPPGDGWVEFDPTNGIVGNRDLIRVAVVRDPRQAVPVSGTWTGFPSDELGLAVEVEVTDETGPDLRRRARRRGSSAA